jgi:thioredoxin 1
MIDISSNSDLITLINDSDTIVVVDFFATWCNPCQQILKIIPRLEEALGAKAVIAKVDTDMVPSLKETYNVTKIPTFVFFKEKTEVHRFEGIKTLKEIEHIVNSL